MDQLCKYPHLERYVSNLRSIPGGQFHWGAPPSEEESGIPITMSPFRMGATPVTWGMWKEYCNSESVPMPWDREPGWGYPDDDPVVNVSWNDIMDPGGFCEWASGVAGFKLTLPSDAQWEYAARGGKDGLEYPWGNVFKVSKLWCSDDFTMEDQHLNEANKTAAVGRTDRIYCNGYGLTDMVGNVWQWCADYANEDYRPSGKDPVDTQMSAARCTRGGGWSNINEEYFRCAERGGKYSDDWDDHVGFRLSAGPVVTDEETVFEVKNVDEKSVKLLIAVASTEDTATGTRQDTNTRFSVRLNNYPALRDYIDSLRVIPGGQFHWGASPSKGESGIQITMSSFRMGATPVTWGMWKEYCKSESVRMPYNPGWGYPDDHPVVKVSWNDIMNPDGFCEWASGVAGFRLTLPTDAQWEYAARGGQDGHDYPWGYNFDESKFWYNYEETAAVDRTEHIYCNGYGLTDMVGNVLQWCADYYNEDYRPAGKDPLDTQREYRSRCVRGGSCYNGDPVSFRCAFRGFDDPDLGWVRSGFRLSAGPG